jgi:endosialidase-like protein
VLDLHPVTFRYTQAYTDGSKPIHYGLVAEEVAEVFPELAVRNANGDIETVHYETLNVLLLNEVQKQQRRIETLEQVLDDLREEIRSMKR